MSRTPPVLAAGALCWRVSGGRPRVLVVHRDTHGDVSLPKGKVDPGETLPETAVREILEETGVTITLGAPLGTVGYRLPGGRDKVVHYWAAEVHGHALEAARFTPNDEIAGLEWLSVEKARKRLTYAHDVDIVDEFARRFEAGRARTFAIIVARHGKAVAPGSWDGPDATRPLLHRGMEQAAAIARAMAAFAPQRIISSTAARCVATIEPLASLTGIPVKATSAISQDAWEQGLARVPVVVAKRVRKHETVVLCSHGPVIPRIVDEVAAATGTKPDAALRDAASLATGSFTALHVSVEHPDSGLVAFETHGA